MSSFIINDEPYEALAVIMIGRGDTFMSKLHLLGDDLSSKVRGHILCLCEGISLEAKIVTALWFANCNAVAGRYKGSLPPRKQVMALYGKLVSRIKERFLGIDLAKGTYYSAVDFDPRMLAALYRCWDYQCSEEPKANPEIHAGLMAVFGLFVADLLSDSLSKESKTRIPENLEPVR